MSHELPNLRWCIHFTSLTCRLVVRETAYKSLASIAYQCPLPKSSKLEGWSMSQSSSNNPKVSGVEVDRGPSKSGTTLRGVRRSRFSLCALIASIASSAGCDVRHKSAQNQIGSSTGKLIANIYMYVGLLKFWYMKYRLNHITRLHLIWQIPIYVYIIYIYIDPCTWLCVSDIHMLSKLCLVTYMYAFSADCTHHRLHIVAYMCVCSSCLIRPNALDPILNSYAYKRKIYECRFLQKCIIYDSNYYIYIP